VLIDVENTSGLARLPVESLIRDAKRHDRSGIFKIPLPIESIHLRHRRLDFVGTWSPSGLQALEQAFYSVTMGHHSFQWSGAQLLSIRCFSSIVSNSRASSGAALDSSANEMSVARGRNNATTSPQARSGEGHRIMKQR
jgi:hypothetical protein